jgi:hypothetical protein
VNPEPHFVTTRGIDVMNLGLVRLTQSTVMLGAIVIENDLLIELLYFHRSPPKKAIV